MKNMNENLSDSYRLVLRSEIVPVDKIVTAKVDLVKLEETQSYAINLFLCGVEGLQLIDHIPCGTFIYDARHQFTTLTFKLLTGAVLD